MKKTIAFLLLCLLMQSMNAQSGLQMFDNTYVHDIRIYSDEPNFWQILTDRYDAWLNEFWLANTPLPAQVVIDGTVVDSVGVSQKGFFSNWGAEGSLKKPIKLDFNEYRPDQKYDQLRSLNLQNAFYDPTLMHDMLGYQILRDFGLAASRTSYAKVYINDVYWGLYVVVESVNKTFLKEHFGNNDGNLYKAEDATFKYLGLNQSSYLPSFELKTNETENDWSRLIQLIKKINQTPNSVFRDTLSKYMDMESYLKTLAVDVTICNWDSHFDHGRNFYIYDNPVDGKFYWIPWDYNLAFEGNEFAQYDITFSQLRADPQYGKILPQKVMANASLRQDYLNYACELHQDVFTSEHLDPIIDATETLITADLEADSNKFYPNINDFHESLAENIELMISDTVFAVDSIWNGNSWEVFDTSFVWEYPQVFYGLNPLIANRHLLIQDELTNVWNINCLSPVEEPVSVTMEIWPNPAIDWLHIRTQEAGDIRLINTSGQVVYHSTSERSESHILLDKIPPGMYWVELVSDHSRSVEKVVIGTD